MRNRLIAIVMFFAILTGFLPFDSVTVFANSYPVLEMNDAGIMVEAEDLELKNAVAVIEEPDASGGKAISPTSESISPSGSNEVSNGRVEPGFTLKVNVKETGNYMVYFRMSAGSATSSSSLSYTTLYLQLNNENAVYCNPRTTGGEYEWVAIKGYKLFEGENTIKYYTRWGMKIDKVIITNNACEPPIGIDDMPQKFSLDNVKMDYENLLYPLPPVVPQKEHPRLFVTKDKIPQIRENLTHEQNILTYNKLRKVADNNYDCLLDQKNVTNNSNYTYLEYIDANAFLYLINGDKTAGNKAVNGIVSYLRTLNVAEGDIASRDGMVAIFVAACVYDWCHDIISKETKEEMINLCLLCSSKAEFGWPPTGLNAYNSDHGDEYVLLKNLFAFTIAIYDDFEKPYNIVAGRLFSEFVPSRNAKFEENIYNTQGDDYGSTVRGGADFFFRLLLDGLGCADMLSDNMHEAAYAHIFRKVPSGWHMQDSDIYTYPSGGYSVNYGTYFIGATLFKDPYLKGEYFLDDRGNGVSHLNDRRISSAMYLLLNDVSVGTLPKEQLPLSIYTGDTSGIMVARTSWDMGYDSNAFVVSMKTPEKFFGGHGHRDAGHFYIYYKGPLALDSGIYQSEPFVDQNGKVVTSGLGVGSDHHANYSERTIAHNCMLIYDPDQKQAEASNGKKLVNTGSQTEPARNSENYEKLSGNFLKMGEVIAKDMGDDLNKPDYTYLSGNIAGAYGYRAKEYTRSFMYYNFFDEVYPGALIVFDRVTSSDPSFKKTWLLHSQNEPTIEANRTTVRYDEYEYDGRLINDTLLPTGDNAKITKIGGPGKEFLIGDWNYTAIPTETVRDESGKWRVEISPSKPAEKDYFLNVIQVGESSSDPEPLDTELIESDKFYGAKIKDRVAFFSKENQRHKKSFEISVPGEKNETMKIAVADLAEGVWKVEKDGKLVTSEYVTKGGTVLYFDGTAGNYKITRSREYVKPYEKDLSILSRLDTSIEATMNFNCNNVFYSSIIPIEYKNEVYVPASKIVPLFDDLAQIDVSGNTMTATLYDELARRTVVFTADSSEADITIGGKYQKVKLNFPIRLIDGEFYVHYQDLNTCYDVDVEYGPLGKVVAVTSSFKRVDNSQYIVSTDDTTRARVKDVKASSHESSLPPYKAFDNNIASWFTCDGSDEWLIIELEEETNIKELAVIFGNRSIRQEKFAVDVSADGETYTEVFNGMSEVIVNDETTFEIFDVKAEKVKFVRLRLFGNTRSKKNTIYELYITKQ